MKKNFLSAAVALTAAAVMTCNAFAYAPSAYDGQSYESVGYTSEDADGQINLAVISNGDVNIYGDAMYIEGSVYSNGNIYVGDGAGNKIDGLFISGTEGSYDESTVAGEEGWQCDGYIHVNDYGTREGITSYSTKPEYAGAIKDDNTGFECSYSNFVVPNISNDLGDTTMTVYYNDDYSKGYNVYDDDGNWVSYVPGTDGTEPKTIAEDTHIGTLTMDGTQSNWRGEEYALIIDTTAGDVTVVIDSLEAVNPSIKVVGDHQAYIYIKNVSVLKDLVLNYNGNTAQKEGSVDNTHLYLEGTDVVIQASVIAVADINVNAASLEVSGSAHIYGDINSGAESFAITGGTTDVTGIVCVPNAASQVVDSGTLYGQLHTDTLTINGSGRIIWQADSAVASTSSDETTEITTENIPEEDVYGVLGAKVIWFDVRGSQISEKYQLGRIKLVGHTPDGVGHNAEELGYTNSDLHYTVLDESTYWHTDEQLSESDWNEAVRRVTAIYEISQKYLDSNTSGEDAIETPTVFGRIDSNGYKSSLTVTPYAQAEIQSVAGNNMYVCIADGSGNITDVLMIIDDSVQYEDAYEGNISPYVYSFRCNGYMTYDSILEEYKDSFDY